MRRLAGSLPSPPIIATGARHAIPSILDGRIDDETENPVLRSPLDGCAAGSVAALPWAELSTQPVSPESLKQTLRVRRTQFPKPVALHA